MEGIDTVGRCRSEESLEQVTRRLIREFPGTDAHTVARHVAHAVAAVVRVGPAADELLFVELIARAQLGLRTGERHGTARVVPQRSGGDVKRG